MSMLIEKDWSYNAFTSTYFVAMFVFNDLRWQAIVRFVDIGGIVGLALSFFIDILYQARKVSVHLYVC